MACFGTLGRILPCKDGMAGIRALYFIDFGTPVVTFDATNTNVIDDLGTVTALNWVVKNTGSGLVQTLTAGVDNGTRSVAQVATVILQREEWSTDAELMTLAAGRPHVVVHYKNGQARLMGLYDGVSIETVEANSGAAATDLNGYTLTINGAEEEYAPFLKGATKEDPFAGLTTTPTVVDGQEIPNP